VRYLIRNLEYVVADMWKIHHKRRRNTSSRKLLGDGDPACVLRSRASNHSDDDVPL
jgi:hypothetical protein